MRIAVNTRLLVPEKMDGIGRFSYETLIRIASKNPDSQFTFIFDRKVPTTFQFPFNVKCVSVFPPARHPILWIFWFEISLSKYINRNNFDLFLSPEGWIPRNINCKSLAVIHDLNFLHQPEHVAWSHRIYLKHFFPKFIQRATKIVSVSKFSRDDIALRFNLDSNNIDVVYNGANEKFKAQASSQISDHPKHQLLKNQPYFLFLGTIHPRKNLMGLIKAYTLFRQQNEKKAALVVAGNRKWWPKELENTIQKCEFKEDIVFLGRQTDEELALLLSNSIALTYIPFFEGFGIPILEAFQCRVPVISSSTTSMPEVAGKGGILVDPKNHQAIANAMKDVMKDTPLRENLINEGQKQLKKFSWDKSADLLWQSMVELNEHGS